VPNDRIMDLANTILKMADKRALVAATINATGVSDLFTQDLDDGRGDEREDETPTPPSVSIPNAIVVDTPPDQVSPSIQRAIAAALEVAGDHDKAKAAVAAEIKSLGYSGWSDFLARGTKEHAAAVVAVAQAHDRAKGRGVA
jgi:hypothetical protein